MNSFYRNACLHYYSFHRIIHHHRLFISLDLEECWSEAALNGSFIDSIRRFVVSRCRYKYDLMGQSL